MKTQFSTFAISAMILSTATFSVPVNSPVTKKIVTVEQAQSPGFAFFRTHRQGKGVTASWGLTSNAGVVGFEVQKTYEDPTDPYAVWEDVSSLPCEGSRSYKTTDNSVFPGSISYRVSAVLSDGSKIESGISSVRIVSR
jgi:hypothetical protein